MGEGGAALAYQMGCSIARAHHPASEYDSNDDHADGDVGESGGYAPAAEEQCV